MQRRIRVVYSPVESVGVDGAADRREPLVLVVFVVGRGWRRAGEERRGEAGQARRGEERRGRR